MHYVVALGNPGKEYESTRHNVGWLMGDMLRRRLECTEPTVNMKYLGRVSLGVVDGEGVSIFYPDTYMNNSGSAVAKLVSKEERNKIIVLQDETALSIGTVKLSTGRGDGGHNGVKSLINSLGTKDFTRIRIGVAPTSFFTGRTKIISGEKLPKFVLGRFNRRELAQIMALEDTILEMVRLTILRGAAYAMNRFN